MFSEQDSACPSDVACISASAGRWELETQGPRPLCCGAGPGADFRGGPCERRPLLLCSTDGAPGGVHTAGLRPLPALGVWVPRPLETRSSLEAEQPWGLRHLTALASSLNHCCPFSLTPPSTRAVTQLLTQGISHPLQSVQGSSPSPCFSQACRGLGSEAH